MPKGFFTASVAVLLDAPVGLEEIEQALGGTFAVAKRAEGRPPGAERDWMGSFPALVVAMRPEVNGYVIVDIVDRPWPDAMAGAKGAADDHTLFAAWAMGWFGPFVWPGGLERAAANSPAWEDAAEEAVARHGAFIRMKVSYTLGAGADAAMLPDDYDPIEELWFLSNLARALGDLPGALAYYNPNGETLHRIDDVERALAAHEDEGTLPLDVWTSVRATPLEEAEGWGLVDTVGLRQVELSDLEACFPLDAAEEGRGPHFAEAGRLVRNVAVYLATEGEVIGDGHTLEGPGGTKWVARMFREGLRVPHRDTLRLFPADGPEPPEALLRQSENADEGGPDGDGRPLDGDDPNQMEFGEGGLPL